MKTFEELSKIDVSPKMEKKGKFTYLSWPYAVSEFRKNCPNGIWATVKHNGSPILTTEQGHFVEVEVTPDTATPEIKFSQIHPILDQSNKPISAPNAFHVNTSIQRCLVKAIAIATGIGLFIYAGEDLPEQEEPATPKDSIKQDLANDAANDAESRIKAKLETLTTLEAVDAWEKVARPSIDTLPKTQKAKAETAIRCHKDMIREIQERENAA